MPELGYRAATSADLDIIHRELMAVIDEFENDLHPHMLEPILDLFASPVTNPHGGQLLFTCHAMEVLNVLHKSQVMLVEKSADCESTAWRMDSIQGIRTDDNFYAKYMAGAYGAVMEQISTALAKGAIVSDVGSVKQHVVKVVAPFVPEGVHFVPAHPIAGTEHSGPSAGFPELFVGRWCVLTPAQNCDPVAANRLRAFWEALGSNVEVMSPEHHDLVLAITSHVPHLVAYNIVGTVEVGENGQFTVPISPAQNNGQLLTVVSMDDAGNASVAVPYQTNDTSPPDLVTNLAINNTFNVLTGKGEANATVTVTHSGTPDLGYYTRQADIVVAAVGRPGRRSRGRDLDRRATGHRPGRGRSLGRRLHPAPGPGHR